MEWMLMPLQRYADFTGRSRRKEFWMFFLGLIILYAVVGVLAATLGGFSTGQGNFFGGISATGLILFGVIGLALLIPSLAVYVRRFHDQDRSGWWVLLMFVPYLGGLILLVFMCIEGTRGENRFGPDPKGSAA